MTKAILIALILFVGSPQYAYSENRWCSWIFGAKKKDAQMEVWEQYEAGNVVLAHKLRSQIEEKLKTMKVTRILSKEDAKIGGLTRTYQVRLKDGTRAIFKPYRQDRVLVGFMIEMAPPNNISEVIAYELDKLIEWNVVPLTVERRIQLNDGTFENGSLQIWLNDVKSKEDFWRANQLSEFPREEAKISIFYGFMENSDGNGPLVTSRGRQVGSDFGYGLHPTRGTRILFPFVYARDEHPPWSSDLKTATDEKISKLQDFEVKKFSQFQLTYEEFLQLEKVDGKAFDQHFAGKNLPERELGVLKAKFQLFQRSWRFYYDLGYRTMVRGL